MVIGIILTLFYASKSSHNPKVRDSNPLPATNTIKGSQRCYPFFIAIKSFNRGYRLQSLSCYLLIAAAVSQSGFFLMVF